MKKVIIIIFALGFLFASCSKENEYTIEAASTVSDFSITHSVASGKQISTRVNQMEGYSYTWASKGESAIFVHMALINKPSNPSGNNRTGLITLYKNGKAVNASENFFGDDIFLTGDW